MYKIIIVIIIVAVIIFIERFVFSPFFSDAARKQFILDNLKAKTYQDLLSQHSEVYTYKNRRASAHWQAHRRKENPSISIIEFDVHPSTQPYGSISRSEFITVKDEQHFADIQRAVKEKNSYDEFLTKDEEFKEVFGADEDLQTE